MRLTILGAAQAVTGSSFLLETKKHRVLIDCGLVQGSHTDEAQNAAPFAFDPKHLDAVILTHAHIDHSGRLPLLVKSGFKGPIYTHHATRDLCEIMLLDSAFIQEKDTEIDNKKRARRNLPSLTPLYTEADVKATLPLFSPLDYRQKKNARV